MHAFCALQTQGFPLLGGPPSFCAIWSSGCLYGWLVSSHSPLPLLLLSQYSVSGLPACAIPPCSTLARLLVSITWLLESLTLGPLEFPFSAYPTFTVSQHTFFRQQLLHLLLLDCLLPQFHILGCMAFLWSGSAKAFNAHFMYFCLFFHLLFCSYSPLASCPLP